MINFNGLSFHLRTFGCQMNKHDSERVAGMLEALGARATDTSETADIIIFMTCCVREAADVRLLGQVASLGASGKIIAVGGCIGQRDGEKLLIQLPHISVVFGTHNIAHLPALLAAALEGQGTQVEVLDVGSDVDLPAHREQSWHAWLSIMTGCDNFCSYCVVPSVRGREHSRSYEDVITEAEQLVADGVREITLLGQNVNSYGRDLYGEPRFAEVLRAVGATGIERLRFATSHPKDLSDATIAAFAETPAVMPQLHLPVQSGSDRILAAMNRNYTAEHYLELVDKIQSACRTSGKGEIALSTDIIVGFPGETAEDFEATLALVAAVGYAQAFTFIYSRRDGTPAAALVDETPHEVIQERFDRLVTQVQQSAWECNQLEFGTTMPVLFEGASKRDVSMLAGRSPKNQTVHVPLPAAETFASLGLPANAQADDFAGRIFAVQIEEARTWYLRGVLV
jgi:tRNA-2-methylthio-N6-dimethylallyladenosine synthase